MTPFDTQTVKADLTAELRKAEQAQAEKPTLETLSAITWLRGKLEFLSSDAYQRRKQWTAESQYPPVGFERVPDEGLL